MGELPDYPGNAERDAPAAHDELDQRLMELEIKAAYAEDLLETLNAQIARQQEVIETLVREIRRLREQQSRVGDDRPASLRDDLPPHY